MTREEIRQALGLMSPEEWEASRPSKVGTRATGRTTEMILDMIEWHLQHPHEKVYYTAHSAPLARFIKGRFYAYLNTLNVALPPMEAITNVMGFRSLTRKKLFIDHATSDTTLEGVQTGHGPPAPPGYHYHSNGGGLVKDTAFVDSTAYVGPFARVEDGAQVRSYAKIRGTSVIRANASVWGSAVVGEGSVVEGNAEVRGSTTILDSRVAGRARVWEDASIENSIVLDDAKILGFAQVANSTVAGKALVGTGANVLQSYVGNHEKIFEWVEDRQKIEAPEATLSVDGNLIVKGKIVDQHALEQKQKELEHRERTLNERESQISFRETSTSSRECDLSVRESEVSRKEMELNAWGNLQYEKDMLQSKKEDVDRRMTEVYEREDALRDQENELSRRVAEVTARESRADLAEQMEAIKDSTFAIKSVAEAFEAPVQEASVLREKRFLASERNRLEVLRNDLEQREKRVEELEGRTIAELSEEADKINQENMDMNEQDPTAPKNAAIKNTANAASQAFIQGAKLAGANKLNQMITQAAKRLLVESGVPKEALDNPAVEATLKLTTPFVLHYVCEKFPQVIPAPDIMKAGAEAAITSATFEVLMPLLEKIGPDLMAIKKEAEAIVTEAPGLAEASEDNVVKDTINAKTKVEDPVAAPV